MQKATRHHDGIHIVDSHFGRPGLAAIYIVLHHGRAAIIDTGNNAAVPHVLAALNTLGVEPEAVDWVILTHIHLDHAGGAGRLLRVLPNAKLIVHPRGVRHMINPERLWNSTAAIYGKSRAFALYGHINPICDERILAADDTMQIALEDRALTIFHTPGHANHHISIWDEWTRSFFTGDTFGLSYRELDTDGRSFVYPTTTPPEFDPDALHRSIDLLLSKFPEVVYVSHFGRVTDVERLAADLHRLIDSQVAVACAAHGEGEARQNEILAGLEQIVREENARQGWLLPEGNILALLHEDLLMNAKGLNIWLDRQLQALPLVASV